MNQSTHVAMTPAEPDLPTDLLAGLLMEQARAPKAAIGLRVPIKVYGVMAITTALTFTTLVSGYQWLFVPQLFA